MAVGVVVGGPGVGWGRTARHPEPTLWPENERGLLWLVAAQRQLGTSLSPGQERRGTCQADRCQTSLEVKGLP